MMQALLTTLNAIKNAAAVPIARNATQFRRLFRGLSLPSGDCCLRKLKIAIARTAEIPRTEYRHDAGIDSAGPLICCSAIDAIQNNTATAPISIAAFAP